jgi:Acyl-CoA dehydrogenase, C-terminal domain
MRIIPSDSVITNCTELERLLCRYANVPVVPDHFDQDWGPLWSELVSGGWLDVIEAGETSDRSALVDVAYVAERWGRYLIPLPLTEALWLSLLGKPPGPVALARADGKSAICHPATLLSARRAGKKANVDYFAPSRPVVLTAELPDPDAVTMISLLCAEAVGCAATALDQAVAYAGTREAYGKPIASYQSLRHLLADAYTDVELARSAVLQAVYEDDPAVAASSALMRSRRTISAVIQVYGGIGFTWEAGLHFYLRHAIAVEQLVGGFVAAQRAAALHSVTGQRKERRS